MHEYVRSCDICLIYAFNLELSFWPLFEVFTNSFVFLHIFANRLEFRKRAQIQTLATVRSVRHEVTQVEEHQVRPHHLKHDVTRKCNNNPVTNCVVYTSPPEWKLLSEANFSSFSNAGINTFSIHSSRFYSSRTLFLHL